MSSQWLSFFSILVGLTGAVAALIPFIDAKKKNGRLDLPYSFARLSHERFSDACRKFWRSSTVIALISYLAIAFGDKVPELGLRNDGTESLIALSILLTFGTTVFQRLLMTVLALKEFKLFDNYLGRSNYSVVEYVKDALWVSWVFSVIPFVGVNTAFGLNINSFHSTAFFVQLTASLCSCLSAYAYAYTKYRNMHKVTKILVVTKDPMQTFDNIIELRREDDEYVALLPGDNCAKVVAIPIDNVGLVKKTLDVNSLLLEYHLGKRKRQRL